MCWLFLFIGIIIGFMIATICNRVSASGTVEMDRTDPELPYLRLQLTDDQLDTLHKKKYVMFKVDSNANFTREKQSL